MHQFIHIESYAKTPSTQKKPSKPKTEQQALKAKLKAKNAPPPDKKWGVKDILDEALRREPDACKHVLIPNMKPNFILGTEDDLNNLEKRLDRIVENVRAVDKRKAQDDTHILLAGVASFPREVYETEPDLYEKWKDKTVEYLKEKFGTALVSIIEHLDERQPHFHFYCINEQGANVKLIHDGYIAQSKEERFSKAGKEAYKKAMSDFQTDYHEKVGMVIGMTRDGPKRQRLTGVENAARKKEARQVARDIQNISESCLEMMVENSKLERKKSNITEQEYEFLQYKKAEEKRVSDLKEELHIAYQMKMTELAKEKEELAEEKANLLELARRVNADKEEVALRAEKLTEIEKWKFEAENKPYQYDWTEGLIPGQKKSATRADDFSMGS
jgi:hypothetical protein